MSETTTNEIPANLRKQIPEAVQRKVAAMDEINQQAFLAEFRKKRKSAFLAFMFVMAIPSFHYFYLGRIWLQIVFWGTIGGFGIWWLVDLFRVGSLVREYNKTVAIDVLKDVQILS